MRTWLYLPTGNKIEFEFSDSSIPEDDYANAIDYTNRMLKLGASVNAPGLEAGEEKSDIGFIARWLKNDNDGGTSNRVDLYVNHPKMTSRYMSLYVKNTPESNAEFERITGVNLNRVNMLPTKAPMNKEEDRNGCIVALPKPLVAIWKHNPDYKEGVLDGEPARLFVRWESVGTPTQPPPSQLAPEPAKTGANSSAAPAAATSTPKTPENAGNGDQGAWWNEPIGTGATWKHAREYLKKTGYIGEHDAAISNSIAKHAKNTDNWRGMTAGQVVTYLNEHHGQVVLPEAI